jgi:hypothetical protein
MEELRHHGWRVAIDPRRTRVLHQATHSSSTGCCLS